MKGDYEIVGLKHSKWTPQDSGREISGYSLFMTEEREDVDGLAVERAFITDAKLKGYTPALGDVVNLIYNRFGKVDGVRLVNL